MFSFLVWVFLLNVPAPQAAENVGTRVVVRNTFGGRSSENTTYSLSDRRRLEVTRSVQRTKEDGSVEWVDEVTNVLITRCDLGQSYVLNAKVEEYTSTPYPSKRLTPEEMAAREAKTSSAQQPTAPTLRIETTTVVTGEREEIFGRVARHVITTTKQIPLEGSHAQPQETVRDGWYIDDDRRLSCEPKPPKGSKTRGFLYAGAVVGGSGKEMLVEKPEFVNIGEPETGFPVKEVRTSKGPAVPEGGARRFLDSTNASEVTHYEEGPLDPALFEIPSGYKHVEPSQQNVR